MMQQEKRWQEQGGEPLHEVQPAIARSAHEQVQATCASQPDFCSKMNLVS